MNMAEDGPREDDEAHRLPKSASAFRTISEVAADLDLPQHVLRFWESRFSQVQPLKRGGGRRYYRPEDVSLLRQIRDLLYKEGYTIKGVQKLLEEERSRRPQAAPDGAGRPAGHLDSRRRAELEAVLGELEEIRAILKGRGNA
jgi:DNA-binding transcriptional MerR regulator